MVNWDRVQPTCSMVSWEQRLYDEADEADAYHRYWARVPELIMEIDRLRRRLDPSNPDRVAQQTAIVNDVQYLARTAAERCQTADPRQVKRLQTYLAKWLHDQEKEKD